MCGMYVVYVCIVYMYVLYAVYNDVYVSVLCMYVNDAVNVCYVCI